MYNYISNDQTPRKTTKQAKQPMTPIESTVSMPLTMQPLPQPNMNTTCIYPGMDMQPTMPQPPCMQSMCPNCMYYNICMQQPMMPYPHTNMPSPDPSCDMSKTQDDMEVAYIKKMYPPLCQKIQRYVEREINQYDHELSPIYEMYPASETIDYMANCIYTNMKADMDNLIKEFEGNASKRSPAGGSFYTLIYVLLLNELYRKRMRRRLYR